MCSGQFYAVRSLAPGDGYQAVWAFQSDDSVSVERWPLAFVGVADVMECQDGQWVGVDTQIVGVELVGGMFKAVANIPCCYGIVRDSATHDECLDLIPGDLRSHVIQPVVTSTSDVTEVGSAIECK